MLHLERVVPVPERLRAVDHGRVGEAVMAELVGEREALALRRLSPVDEQQRASRTHDVRARNSVAEVEQDDMSPAALLDGVEQIG